MSTENSPLKEEASSTANPNYSQMMQTSSLAATGFAELESDDDDEDIGMDGSVQSGDRRRLFSKELRLMLFGHGDDANPYTETVDTLEDLVLEFITDMTTKAMDIGRPGRVQVEDITFLVRKHPRMYARVKDLLRMDAELKRARKAFEETKFVQDAK